MQNSFTFTLNINEQNLIVGELAKKNYESATVPHTLVAASQQGCRINLYKSGKGGPHEF